MNEELKIIISAEIDKLKSGVQNAKKQVNDFKAKVKEASKNVDETFSKIGTSIGNGLKTVGTTVAAVGTALLALGASTAEYRAEQSKLVTAFETAGSTAETAKETYNDLYRVLGDGGQATEAANHLAKLTTEEKALNEWTTICQGVYATFGDSLPIEGLTEAANETAKVGTLTGGLADALNWAGVNEEAFQEKLDACNTEAEREALIRSTLNGLYSEAAAGYETNNAQVLAQNEAQAALQETMAALGEAVAPVVTAFTAFASEALAVVTPYIQQLADTYLPSLQAVLGVVAETLGKVMGFLVDNWGTVLTVAAVIGGIAAAIGLYNTVAAIKAAMDAAQVTTLWGLVAAYAAQAAAMIVAIAPYALIVAAIAAVIAIIVVCVKHWDTIKAKVAEVWTNIKNKTSEAVAAVKAKFTEMKTALSAKVTEIKTAVTNKFNEIKTGITTKITAAKTAVTSTFNNIKTSISTALNAAKSSVTTIFSNIYTSISTKITNAKNKVKSVIDAIKGFFNFKFSWPSIPMPHFGISPSGWKIGDLLKGSIPKLNISWYAQGGVFDKPTLFTGNGVLSGLGENGAEAVVPLEKNTQWLDRISDMLYEKMGGNKPVVLMVDGKVFAETAINTINSNTKQTGRLALNII